MFLLNSSVNYCLAGPCRLSTPSGVNLLQTSKHVFCPFMVPKLVADLLKVRASDLMSPLNQAELFFFNKPNKQVIVKKMDGGNYLEWPH